MIQSALGLSQEQLLRQLKPRLRGWANFYRNGAAKRTFKKLDDYVYHRLWCWATRRHPTKSSAWKRQKYFCATGQPGTFGAQVRRATGELRVLALYLLASTRIERHIKVRGAANPYDPTCNRYFAQRRCFAWRVL